MSLVETITLTEDWDVDLRLSELGLDRFKLIACRDAALIAASDADPLFPTNAQGTFSYHYGTRELRVQFLGDMWVMDRKDGVEAISNELQKVKIIFQNVDLASSVSLSPKPRSRKGGGAERACEGNLFEAAGQDLPHFRPRLGNEEWSTFYLMVSENGAAELSRPVVENGTFTAFVERIFIVDADDWDETALMDSPSDDAITDFDVAVDRKK